MLMQLQSNITVIFFFVSNGHFYPLLLLRPSVMYYGEALPTFSSTWR